MIRTHYIFIVILLISNALFSQEKEKKFKLKKPNFKIGAKIGELTGNLMTSKTDDLGAVSIKGHMICGIYPPETGTTEMDIMNGKAKEGDFIAGISFLKQEGIGMYEIKGDVTCNGEPMEYYGLGSYGKVFDFPPLEPAIIKITTETGDHSAFTFKPIAGIDLMKVNGEFTLPIIDLGEDMAIEFWNPNAAVGTDVKVSMLTDVMGVRALNHFAEFKVKKAGKMNVVIPREALANPEIAGELGVGNFKQGENYLIIEREQITHKADQPSGQNPGKVPSYEISARSYSSMPVIVKGKQDGGLLVNLKIAGKTEDKTVGFDFSKPNANTGIPLIKGKKFGLVSFTMSAETYKKESETSSSSYTVGNTRYTTTTTTTTTWEFPQLPDSYWDEVMEKIYGRVTGFLYSQYGIEFVPVDQVTSTPEYQTLFPANQENTKKGVEKSYKNTMRNTPRGFQEIFGAISSNQTSDNPTVNMMKHAGDLDGLLAMRLTLTVGANREGNIVLFPSLHISAYGRDETNDDKQGVYFNGLVTRTVGEAFNEELLKSDPSELLRVVSYPELTTGLVMGIQTLRKKEIELGYDKIWSIGD